MDLKEFLTVHKTFVVDTIRLWLFQIRYNASCNTEQDREKWEYSLLRKTHTVEKGLSLRNPRVGFGQQKVSALLDELARYQQRFGQEHPGFIDYPLHTIGFWIDYTRKQGVEIREIERKFEGFDGIRQCHPEQKAKDLVAAEEADTSGVVLTSRAAQQQGAQGNFESLLRSRHSVRYFTDELVSHEVIDLALTMAQLTPSACNRQGWKTHVFEGEACHRLLKWHGGTRGFEVDVHQAIVVTANQKAFFYYEMYQAYVDGGLYGMNLINALHSLGLGTIPLSCGFKQRKLKGLHQMGIPAHEVPVLIVGFGQLPEEFKVAASVRKPISETNTYHL